MSASDEDIVRQVTEGNMQRYGELVERYEHPLLRYVLFLIHDRDLAEDVLQDTFIKAYRNLRSFNPRLKFSSWLYRIAHNTAIDAVKHRRPIQLNEQAHEQWLAVESNTAARIDRAILGQDVRRCLATLHAKYREPLYLHFLQHKSYLEIADIMRLPTSTVGVRIGRAKQMMRDICREQGVTYEGSF